MSQDIHLCLVGAGLIGSSIARAARKTGAANRISVLEATADMAARVSAQNIADDVSTDAKIISDANLIILCTPVGQMGAAAQAIAPFIKSGAILSDVGSVKAAVVRDVEPHLSSNVHFIPAHPVAGTEKSGPEAGFASLFENRWCILTPPTTCDEQALQRLTQFWQRLGSRKEVMTPEHHDLVLAITSHLPHLIAYNIVGTADDLANVTQSEVIQFSAGGFRDFTRLAASDPTMWRDVFLNNKDAVLEVLARFNEDLSALARAIRWGDGDALYHLFSRTRTIRRSIIEIGQETAKPDFGRNNNNN